MSDLIEFQEQFISDMRKYPRSVLYELWDGEFKKAKLFFGEGKNLDGNEVGFYKRTANDTPYYYKYQDVYAYQFHMMRMCISDDPMKYLENFHQKTLSLVDANTQEVR